jgi:hypothetical protein
LSERICGVASGFFGSEFDCLFATVASHEAKKTAEKTNDKTMMAR